MATDTQNISVSSDIPGRVPVVKITPPPTRSKSENDRPNKNVSSDPVAGAKALEPAIDGIIGVISGTQSKFMGIAAEIILEDEKQAESFAKAVEISPASRDALKVAGARIIARRGGNVETLDWAMIGAAVSEIGISWTITIRELTKIRKLKEKQNAELVKKS